METSSLRPLVALQHLEIKEDSLIFSLLAGNRDAERARVVTALTATQSSLSWECALKCAKPREIADI